VPLSSSSSNLPGTSKAAKPFSSQHTPNLTLLPASAAELGLPPREPGHYVAIAFEVCGFLLEPRIDTGEQMA
jgi:hypothetical protein